MCRHRRNLEVTKVGAHKLAALVKGRSTKKALTSDLAVTGAVTCVAATLGGTAGMFGGGPLGAAGGAGIGGTIGVAFGHDIARFRESHRNPADAIEYQEDRVAAAAVARRARE